jgi:hypothetical protein
MATSTDPYYTSIKGTLNDVSTFYSIVLLLRTLALFAEDIHKIQELRAQVSTELDGAA